MSKLAKSLKNLDLDTKNKLKEQYNIEKKQTVSSKLRLVALILAINMGVLGAHRFYVGKFGTAILYILTGGFLGIGLLCDVVAIVKGIFTDKSNNVLDKWIQEENTL